jgi:hypothetical protein
MKFLWNFMKFLLNFYEILRNFYEIPHLNIFKKSFEKIPLSLKPDRKNGYFTWRPLTNTIISRSFLLTNRQVSHKNYRENYKTNVLCPITLFTKKLFHLLYNVEKHGTTRQITDDNITRLMRNACWVPKAIDA